MTDTLNPLSRHSKLQTYNSECIWQHTLQFSDLWIWVSFRFVSSAWSLDTALNIHTFQTTRPQWTNYSVILNRKYNIFFCEAPTGQNSHKNHSRNCIAVTLYRCDSGYPHLSPLSSLTRAPSAFSSCLCAHTDTIIIIIISSIRSTFYIPIAYIVFWGWKYVVIASHLDTKCFLS